jgi:hypothetical protein
MSGGDEILPPMDDAPWPVTFGPDLARIVGAEFARKE